MLTRNLQASSSSMHHTSAAQTCLDMSEHVWDADACCNDELETRHWPSHRL